MLAFSNGLPGRYSAEAAAIAQFLDVDTASLLRDGRCFLQRTDSISLFDRSECLPNNPDRPTYLLVGDSYAAHLFAGAQHVFPEANILQVTGVMCPPLSVPRPHVGRACPELIDLAFAQIPKERKITKVWLSARWNGGSLSPSSVWGNTWMLDLKKTVESLRARNIDVVIIGPSPEFQEPLPSLLAKAIELQDPRLVQRFASPAPIELDRRLAKFSAENGLDYVSVADRLCPDNWCAQYTTEGIPMIFDRGHFTEAGSIVAVKAIAERLR